MTPGKTIALTRWTFVGKVIPLLFIVLSRLVILFLPKSKRLLISWLQSLSAVILKPKKIKSVDCGLFVVDVSLYVWNKQTIKKKKIMVSSPITSWQVDRETVRDITFLGSKIPADGDCSHEIKDAFSLEEKL